MKVHGVLYAVHTLLFARSAIVEPSPPNTILSQREMTRCYSRAAAIPLGGTRIRRDPTNRKIDAFSSAPVTDWGCGYRCLCS